VVLAAFARSPQKSTRRLAAESGVTKSSIMRISNKHKWNPYKMQMLQHLSEGYPDMEFCKWAVNKFDGDANFSSGILFTEEANFYVNGEVNRQNVRY
jgi:DNA-binding MurR/RpiR family transcriptional regulator